jgi:hypothetical protein
MMNVHKIKSEMPIVSSQDGQFAVVDHLVGEHTIKLNKDKSGQHHYIPVSWVVSTDNGEVKIDRPSEKAMKEWSTSPTF